MCGSCLCAHLPLQVLVRRAHISALFTETPLCPMLPACLPTPANLSKTSCPSPWQCPPLPLALASSHSAQSLTPPLLPSLAHSPGSLSSLRSQPSDPNPLHLLPAPKLLLSLAHLCQLLSSLTAPLPHSPVGPCWVFTNPVITPSHSDQPRAML